MSEPTEQCKELSPEDREFVIDKLAEILVADYLEFDEQGNRRTRQPGGGKP